MAYDVIRTRYYGASTARGPRIRATWGDDSLTMDYPDAAAAERDGIEERHALVASALVRKVGKRGTLRAGADDKTGGYFFAFESDEKPHATEYDTETGAPLGSAADDGEGYNTLAESQARRAAEEKEKRHMTTSRAALIDALTHAESLISQLQDNMTDGAMMQNIMRQGYAGATIVQLRAIQAAHERDGDPFAMLAPWFDGTTVCPPALIGNGAALAEWAQDALGALVGGRALPEPKDYAHTRPTVHGAHGFELAAVVRLARMARDVLDAAGGDTPDWMRAEALALANALEPFAAIVTERCDPPAPSRCLAQPGCVEEPGEGMPHELAREGYRLERGNESHGAELDGRYWWTLSRPGWMEAEGTTDDPDGAGFATADEAIESARKHCDAELARAADAFKPY